MRAGPQQMSGVEIRVGDAPDPTTGAVCKAGDSFNPSVGKVIPCARVLKVRARGWTGRRLLQGGGEQEPHALPPTPSQTAPPAGACTPLAPPGPAAPHIPTLVCHPPTLPPAFCSQGRYLSISATSKVSLCVVEVYPLVSNAALGKDTTASGGLSDSGQVAQVVNGNMANTVCATVVSGSNLAAWITIDLGYEASVETVVVQNGFSKFDNDLYIRCGGGCSCGYSGWGCVGRRSAAAGLVGAAGWLLCSHPPGQLCKAPPSPTSPPHPYSPTRPWLQAGQQAGGEGR